MSDLSERITKIAVTKEIKMAEKQIPGNCVGVTYNARCIKIGVDMPSIGADSGDSLDYALEKIDEKLSGEIESQQTQDTINSNLSCLGGSGTSICASKITSRVLEYTLKPNNASGIDFSWDLKAITQQNLPTGYSITTISVVANSGNKIVPLLDSAAPKATYTFQGTDYPISIDIKVRISTSCGQIELSKSISLINTAEVGTKSTIMSLNDYTNSSIQDVTQDQFNEIVASEICGLKDRMGIVEENSDYSSLITALEMRIKALEDKN